MTVPEIAEVVGAPVETVKSRLRIALGKVQSHLAYLNVVQDSSDLLVPQNMDVSLEGIPTAGEPGARIYHSLGSLYLRKGLIEAALNEWRKAQKVAPTFLDAYMDSAEQYVKLNDPSRAVETLEAAVGKVHNSSLHSRLSILHVELGDLDDGMRHAMRALDLGPQSPEAHFAAGRAYYRQARLQEALQSLSRSPEPIESPVTASWRKAATYLQQAIGLDPKHSQAASYLSLVHFYNDRPEDAARGAESAVKISQEDDTVLYHSGFLHYKAGKLVLAERHLRHAISIRATQEKLSLLGTVYLAQDRPAEAATAFKEALSMAMDIGTKSQIQSNLAAAALKAGDYDAAVEAAETALKIDPKRHHAHCNLAEAYLARNDDPALVAKVCREGLEAAPDHICFHRLLAEALLRQEQLGEALEEASIAVELEPERPERWRLRAVILAKLGHIVESERDLATAARLSSESEHE